MRRATRWIAAALGVVLAGVAVVASADTPTPTSKPTGVLGALSSEIDKAKKDAANAPRTALSSGLGESGSSGSGSTSSGTSSSSSTGGDPLPVDDAASKHDLPSEADLDATLPERRAQSQEQLAARLEKQIGDKPVDDALLAELRRHARLLATLDRIGFVASAEHDDAAMKRVTSLLTEEFQRHSAEVERWAAK